MKIFKTLIASSLICIGCSAVPTAKNPVRIYMIGDSTMALKPDPDKNPERGWGQMLPDFVKPNVIIADSAKNGKSSKSFRDLGHWKSVFSTLKKGDYVIIQFGHNDAKDTDPARYTNPQTAYRYNLIRYIEEARSKGAVPVLCSSIARRKFNEQGVLLDAHGNYTLQARLVAQDLKVPFVDMQYLTENLELRYGVEGSKKLHLHFLPGENSYIPKGIDDNTHLSVLGATEVAKLFVQGVKRQKLPLANYFK